MQPTQKKQEVKKVNNCILIGKGWIKVVKALRAQGYNRLAFTLEQLLLHQDAGE